MSTYLNENYWVSVSYDPTPQKEEHNNTSSNINDWFLDNQLPGGIDLDDKGNIKGDNFLILEQFLKDKILQSIMKYHQPTLFDP